MSEDFQNSLGFDAKQAIQTLGLLDTLFTAYTKVLEENATATKQFNTASSASDDILSNMAKATRKAREEIELLAEAQAKQAAAAKTAADNSKTGKQLDAQRNAVSARRAVEATLGTDFRGKSTLGEIVNFDKSLDQFQTLVLKTQTSSEQVQKILANLRGAYTGTERQIRDAIVRIIQTTNKLGSTNVAATAKVLNRAGKEAEKAAKEATAWLRGQEKAANDNASAANGMLQSYETFARLLTTRIAFQFISGLENQVRESVDSARELEKKIAEIQTISESSFRTPEGFLQLREAIQGISSEFGINQLEVADGLYQALSNQVGDTAQSIDFLREAAGFAKATVSSLDGSVDLLSGTMNAFNQSVHSNQQNMDVFFKTIDLGRVRSEEIANIWGRLAPLASELGISNLELGASIATITQQGIGAEEAVTQLSQLMQELLKPTNAMKKAFADLGIETVQSGLATRGFVGLLKDLVGTTDGTLESTAQLFNNVRGLRGETALTADNFRRLDKVLEEFRTSASGATKAGLELVQGTQADRLQRNLETIRNTFTTALGERILPILNGMIEFLGGASMAANGLVAAITAIGAVGSVAIGERLLTLMGGLILKTNLATGAAKLLSFTLATLGTGGAFAVFAGLGVAIGAVTGYLISASNTATETKAKLKELAEEGRRAVQSALQSVQNRNQLVRSEIARLAGEAIGNLGKLKTAYEDDKVTASSIQNTITDSLKNQLAERLKLVKDFVNESEKIQKESADNIKKINQSVTDFKTKAFDSKFDRALNTKTPAGQASALINRSNELIRKSQSLGQAGDFKQASDLLSSAFDFANRAADITGFRLSGESQINRVIREREALGRQEIAQQQKKASLAKEQEQALKQQADRLEQQISDVNDINKEMAKLQSKGQFEESKKLLPQREAALAEVDKLLKGISQQALTKILDKNAVKQLLEPFRDPLNGKPVPIKFAADAATNELFNTLQETFGSIPLSVKLQVRDITGLPFNKPEDIALIEDKLAKFGQQLESQFENANNANAASNKLLPKAKEGALTANAGLDDFFSTRPGRNAAQTAIEVAKQIQLFNQLKQARENAFKAIDAGDIATLGKTIEVFNEQIEAGSFGKSTESAKLYVSALIDLRNQLFSAGKAQSELNQAQQNLNALDILKRNLGDVSDIDRFNAEVDRTRQEFIAEAQAAAQSGNTITQKNAISVAAEAELLQMLESVTGGYRSQAEAALEAAFAAEQAAAASGGEVQERAYGGLIHYFSGGGMVPHGTDTVPAMLSPGEIVMNRAASGRFYSELMAMNSGIRPGAFHNDSNISGDSFGDITINVHNHGPSLDGAEVQRTLNRAIRLQKARR